MFWTMATWVTIPALLILLSFLYPLVGKGVAKRQRKRLRQNQKDLRSLRSDRVQLQQLAKSSKLSDEDRVSVQRDLGTVAGREVRLRAKNVALRSAMTVNRFFLWMFRIISAFLMTFGLGLTVATMGASVAVIYVAVVVTTQCGTVLTSSSNGNSNSESNDSNSSDEQGTASDTLGFNGDGVEDKVKEWAKSADFTFVGDSLGVGVEAKLKGYFPNATYESKVSRAFTNGDASLAGIEVVKQLESSGKMKSLLVVALGTNQPPTPELMDALVKEAKSAKQIVWINTASEGGTGGYNKIDHDGIAETIKSYVSGKSNMAYLDWNRYVKEKSKWSDLTSDSIHMNDKGYSLYADFIARGLYDYLKGGAKGLAGGGLGVSHPISFEGLDLEEARSPLGLQGFRAVDRASGHTAQGRGQAGTSRAGARKSPKATADKIKDPVLKKAAQWMLDHVDKGIGYPWANNNIDASRRLGLDFYDCSGFVSTALGEASDDLKQVVGFTTPGFLQASNAVGQAGQVFKEIPLEEAPAGAIVISGGIAGAGTAGHIWMLLEDYSPDALVVESHFDYGGGLNGGPSADRTQSQLDGLVGPGASGIPLVALLPANSTAVREDGGSNSNSNSDNGDGLGDKVAQIIDCATNGGNQGSTNTSTDNNSSEDKGDNTATVPDGTDDVPADVQVGVLISAQELPASLKPYIIDPAKNGLKWGSGEGWAGSTFAGYAVTIGQCVDLSVSLGMHIWGWDVAKQGNPPAPNGYQIVGAYAPVFGKEATKKPSRGAYGSTNQASNHTGIVCHVFKDGSALIVEQNTPLSGATAGMPNTWNYRILDTATQEQQGWHYVSGDKLNIK